LTSTSQVKSVDLTAATPGSICTDCRTLVCFVYDCC